MNNKVLLTVTIVVLVLVGILALGGKGGQAQKIKIGILTPQSGDLAFLGENIVKSARLALKELGRTDVELVIEDVGGLSDQTKTVSAFKKMVDIDHVQYIVDGMSSNGTMAIAPVVDAEKAVVVTPLTGGENVDNAAEYLFRNGPSDILGATKPADDFSTKFGYKKIALLTDNAEYTLDIAKHFKATYKGTIVGDHVIPPTQNDYRTDLAKVKSENPDALFINTADGVSSMYLVKQARELGLRQPIFVNFIAFGPKFLEVAGAAAEGVYVYDPEFNESSPQVQAFLQHYQQTYGTESPIRFHTTGTYDAIKMGLEAINRVGYSGPAIHDYLLANIQNWQGYNGTVSFDAKGNTQTGFVLKQIKNGKLVSVK